MSLLVVGTLAFDSIETPTERRDDTLGGSASYLAVASSYFCPVRMVGVVGADFPKEHIELFHRHRIDTRGVEHVSGRTFRWKGRYAQNPNDRETLDTQLNVLATFNPTLPADYCDSEYVVLGNFDPELQLRVLQQVRKPRLVACDTMNYWIERRRPELTATLRKVDILYVNDSEARQLSGEQNLLHAARAIRALGPRILVIKRGEHGATLFTEQGAFAAPALLLDGIRDPTGAGDAFAGGMMGFLAQNERHDDAALRQSVVMGTVLASFAVEDFSLGRLTQLGNEDIRSRVRTFTELTRVEPESIALPAAARA